MLAGGYSLLPMMKLRLATPECLIDIDDLAGELGYIEQDVGPRSGSARWRATGSCSSRRCWPRLAPIFIDAERVIADPVVRNRGTIGGALCQADPSEDLSAVCAAVGARDGDPRARRRANGRRWTSSTAGPYRTAVADDEMLVEIRIPTRERSGSAYEKVDRRVGDWAVVAAGAALSLWPTA